MTVAGGHRIGLAGSVVIEDGTVKSLKDISGMNYRFARQIFGAADNVMNLILQGGEIRRTLIVSPPGWRQDDLAARHCAAALGQRL